MARHPTAHTYTHTCRQTHAHAHGAGLTALAEGFTGVYVRSYVLRLQWVECQLRLLHMRGHPPWLPSHAIRQDARCVYSASTVTQLKEHLHRVRRIFRLL